jgi:hypothetical protein
MRTTVTLDADVVARIKSLMREKGISFKEALNTAIRAGLDQNKKRSNARFRQKSFSMGNPSVPLRKALQLAADLEDEEIVRDLTIRK